MAGKNLLTGARRRSEEERGLKVARVHSYSQSAHNRHAMANSSQTYRCLCGIVIIIYITQHYVQCSAFYSHWHAKTKWPFSAPLHSLWPTRPAMTTLSSNGSKFPPLQASIFAFFIIAVVLLLIAAATGPVVGRCIIPHSRHESRNADDQRFAAAADVVHRPMTSLRVVTAISKCGAI